MACQKPKARAWRQQPRLHEKLFWEREGKRPDALDRPSCSPRAPCLVSKLVCQRERGGLRDLWVFTFERGLPFSPVHAVPRAPWGD